MQSTSCAISRRCFQLTATASDASERSKSVSRYSIGRFSIERDFQIDMCRVPIAPAEPSNVGYVTKLRDEDSLSCVRRDPILERTTPQCVSSRPATPNARIVMPDEGGSLHVDVSSRDLPCTPPRKSPASLSRDGEDASISQAGQSNTEVGGEVSRICAQLIENRLMLAQEAEARRPEYLKRMKRTVQELDLATATDGAPQGPTIQPAANIGITDSPVKGRRLTLFQETSDESFEESLMAGGYGRYVSKFLS